jgi:hypothetical protein
MFRRFMLMVIRLLHFAMFNNTFLCGDAIVMSANNVDNLRNLQNMLISETVCSERYFYSLFSLCCFVMQLSKNQFSPLSKGGQGGISMTN